MSFFPIFRRELRPTLHLALPLILAEIGWMSMVIVDTMMVGRLPYSAEAIGAVSISSSLFLVFAFFGEGLLIGLDTLVSQSFGAGRREDCHTSLVNGIYRSGSSLATSNASASPIPSPFSPLPICALYPPVSSLSFSTSPFAAPSRV
jgi:Na+-driven multidrug efflux pump